MIFLTEATWVIPGGHSVVLKKSPMSSSAISTLSSVVFGCLLVGLLTLASSVQAATATQSSTQSETARSASMLIASVTERASIVDGKVVRGTLTFTLVANDTPLYISRNALNSVVLSSARKNVTMTLSSDADTSGDMYVVNEGEERSFTITTVSPRPGKRVIDAVRGIRYGTSETQRNRVALLGGVNNSRTSTPIPEQPRVIRPASSTIPRDNRPTSTSQAVSLPANPKASSTQPQCPVTGGGSSSTSMRCMQAGPSMPPSFSSSTPRDNRPVSTSTRTTPDMTRDGVSTSTTQSQSRPSAQCVEGSKRVLGAGMSAPAVRAGSVGSVGTRTTPQQVCMNGQWVPTPVASSTRQSIAPERMSSSTPTSTSSRTGAVRGATANIYDQFAMILMALDQMLAQMK